MSNLQWPPPTEALAGFYAACAEPCEFEREVILYRNKNLRGAVPDIDGSRLPVGQDGIDAESIVLWFYRQGWPARQVTAQLIRRERIEGEARFLKQVTVFAPATTPAVYTNPQHGPATATTRPVVGELERIAMRVLADPALALQGFATGLQAVGEAWGKSVEKGRLSAAEGATQEIRAMIQEEGRRLRGEAISDPAPSPEPSPAPRPVSNQPDPNQIIKMLQAMMDNQNQKIDALARELAEVKRGQG